METTERQSIAVGERLYTSLETRIKENDAPDGRKRFTFTISTGSPDRHGTIVEPRGIDFQAYTAGNAVVLYNHDYDKVVGRALSVQVRGNAVIAQMEFDEDDEFARQIMGKVERGFLNATSIGFIVQEMGDYDEKRGALVIERAELVEFSIVTVPSNREALVIERKAEAGLREELAGIKAELAELRNSLTPAAQPAGESQNDEATPETRDADPVPEEPLTPAPSAINPLSAKPGLSRRETVEIIRDELLIMLGRK